MSVNNVENQDDFIDYKQKYFELLALHEQESNKDDVSVLTESTEITTEISIDSIVEDNTAIYRETYKEQYEKLEKITKNIQIINKKLAKCKEIDDIDKQPLIEKLAKNKKKYDNILNSFSEPVKQVVEQSFPL